MHLEKENSTAVKGLVYLNPNFASNSVKVKVTQLGPTLNDPMDYTAHGILQTRIWEWVAFPFSRGSFQTRNQTQVSHIADGFFYQLSHKGSL